MMYRPDHIIQIRSLFATDLSDHSFLEASMGAALWRPSTI